MVVLNEFVGWKGKKGEWRVEKWSGGRERSEGTRGRRRMKRSDKREGKGRECGVKGGKERQRETPRDKTERDRDKGGDKKERRCVLWSVSMIMINGWLYE